MCRFNGAYQWCSTRSSKPSTTCRCRVSISTLGEGEGQLDGTYRELAMGSSIPSVCTSFYWIIFEVLLTLLSCRFMHTPTFTMTVYFESSRCSGRSSAFVSARFQITMIVMLTVHPQFSVIIALTVCFKSSRRAESIARPRTIQLRLTFRRAEYFMILLRICLPCLQPSLVVLVSPFHFRR